MKLLEKLAFIQQQLKAPKNQKNTFGNYNYRSCEDILEAVKPLLDSAILTLSDRLVNVGDRYYVIATATLQVLEEKIFVEAMAREADVQKGMQEAQITGSASSYARKYALNGLFLIDDTKDADHFDNTKQEAKQTAPATPHAQAMAQGKQQAIVNPSPAVESFGVCKDCGAPNKKYSTGKVGCSNFCWKNPPATLPVIQQGPASDDEDFASLAESVEKIPF